MLLVIGLLLFALAVPTVWLNRTIMDTDQWVATVGPLASDPAIQNAVADKVSTALFAKVDVEAEIRSRVPTEVPPVIVNFLAPQVAAQIETYADKLIYQVVHSDQFAKVWTETMRATQQAFVAAIEGGGPGGKITTTNGVITLYTDQFVSAAQERLAATKISGLSKYIPWNKVPPRSCSTNRLLWRKRRPRSACSTGSSGCCRFSRCSSSDSRCGLPRTRGGRGCGSASESSS